MSYETYPDESDNSEAYLKCCRSYLDASRNIEAQFKDFIKHYHYLLRGSISRLDREEFRVKGYNFLLASKDKNLEQLKQVDMSKQADISDFNKRFYRLFEPILFFRKSYCESENPLWTVILEAEGGTYDYSLFCYEENIPDPTRFTQSYRCFEGLSGFLYGLTDFFLDTETKAYYDFKPVYIVVRAKRCRDLSSGPKELLQDTDEPYSSSNGIVLSEAFIERLDNMCQSRIEELAGDNSPNRERVKNIIDHIAQKLKYSFRENREVRLFPKPFSEKVGKILLGKKRAEFLRYIIWLRLITRAGGVGISQNWRDYFYFPVPDLLGTYIHGVAVATEGKIGSPLFWLIDRDAPKLFQRSVLRTGWSQRSRGSAEQLHNFAHNISDPINEAWTDPAMRQLEPYRRFQFWMTKTLVSNVWGTIPLDPEEPVCAGINPDFPEWRGLLHKEVVEMLVERGIRQGLRRAGRRPDFELECDDADQLGFLHRYLGVDLHLPKRVPRWVTYKGFVLCFHHSLWQAAYHALRARYSDGLEGSSIRRHYLWMEWKGQAISIFNRAVPKDVANEEDQIGIRPKDRENLALIEESLDHVFLAPGPKPVNRDRSIWKTDVIYNGRERNGGT